MPNHVRNILTFDCDASRRDEILREIQNDEAGPGSIDFNKIIPMPESLDMTSGSMTDRTINAYLTAINPATPDYSKEKVPLHVFLVVAQQMNALKLFGNHNMGLTEDEMQKCAESMRFEEGNREKSAPELLEAALETGAKYVHNALEYGATTWYDWCNREWGTKWNAYDVGPGDDGLNFSTAWAFPEPVIKALSQKYPDVGIHITWADEDLGNNVGEATFRGGEAVEQHVPHPFSVEAYNMAADAWGYDLEELGYRISDDGSTYDWHDEPDEQADGGMEMQP